MEVIVVPSGDGTKERAGHDGSADRRSEPAFYLFNLEERIPARHLLRLINPIVTHVLAGLREKLEPFYSDIGRPSIDPELMIRMLIVAYSYGIRAECKLCEEVELHLAYRWFRRLDLDDKVQTLANRIWGLPPRAAAACGA